MSEKRGMDPYPYAFIPLAGAVAFIFGVFDENKSRWVWPFLAQLAYIVGGCFIPLFNHTPCP